MYIEFKTDMHFVLALMLIDTIKDQQGIEIFIIMERDAMGVKLPYACQAIELIQFLKSYNLNYLL